MKPKPLVIPDVILVEPKVFGDERGFFYGSLNARAFAEVTDLDVTFVQGNHSKLAKSFLRCLYYQIQQSQGKLVRVVLGRVFDVAVSLRKSSPTFGPEFLYKTTGYYAPEHERCIAWSDPTIVMQWPSDLEPVLSAKGQQGKSLAAAEHFA